MTKTKYAVRVGMGGRLFVCSKAFGLYPATTSDLFNACFFTSELQASRVAEKANGEVVTITITDEDINEEYNSLADQYNALIDENNRLKAELEKKENN